MNQPQPSEKVTMLEYRLTTVERDVQHLQTQLQSYVPVSVNDLQLQSIRSTAERIEGDVKEMKKAVADQKDSLDKLLIRILWGAVSFVLVIVGSVIVFIVTHPGG